MHQAPVEKNPTRLLHLSSGRGDLFKLDPRAIKVERGHNARNFDDARVLEHINTLSASIFESGVLNPVTVRMQDGAAYLVDGECRLRATLLAIDRGAEILTIPAIGAPVGGNEADRLMQSYAKNTGLPFSELEIASIVLRLQRFGWPDDDVAAKMQMTVTRLRWLVSLTETAPAMQTMVKSGQISATSAIKLTREHGSGAVDVAAKALEIATSSGKAKATGKSIDRAVATRTASEPTDEPPSKRLGGKDARTLLAAFRDVNALLQKGTRSSATATLDQISAISATIVEQYGASDA